MIHAAPTEGACWLDGRWVRSIEDVGPNPVGGARDLPPVPSAFATMRVARADRITRLAAAVAWDAWQRCAPPQDLRRVAVVGASVLASAATNARFERRRIRTGRAAPRDFPHTAPNAWAGEVGTALGAMGPCTSLVGGPEVALMAAARAIRWIETGACDRAVVLAAEDPPDDPGGLGVPWRACLIGAAALILEGAAGTGSVALRASWLEAPSRRDAPASLSIDALARLILAARAHRAARIVGVAPVGASVAIDVIVQGA